MLAFVPLAPLAYYIPGVGSLLCPYCPSPALDVSSETVRALVLFLADSQLLQRGQARSTCSVNICLTSGWRVPA